jgi:adenylosuccinate synthase
VVVDLGFGDAGKGLLTDHFVRTTGARLVVRYNGGAQAGHNVIAPDGRHHTFAQFGAGAFVEGVRTFLSRHVVVHPTALLAEAAALEAKGVRDPLAHIGVSDRARVVTPFHQALGRLRELARGAARHGSCGAGVGETVRDVLENPADAVRAGDLLDVDRLCEKVLAARRRLAAILPHLHRALPSTDAARAEIEVFTRDDVPNRWIERAVTLAQLGSVTGDATLARWMAEAPTTVFEGAQGVLLDEDAGFHPYTTWSRCTDARARELIAESVPGAEVETVGVLRSHAVRHGPGPLPTEASGLAHWIGDHNAAGPWQGPVRYGWFDAVLARYALDVCPVDRLAITHLDVPPRLGTWRLARGYERVAGLAAPVAGDLLRQEQLTGLLGRATPVLAEVDARDVVPRLEDAIGRSIDLMVSGPRASDVAARPTAAAPSPALESLPPL